MSNLKLEKLSTDLARITGRDLVLENKENGTIYMTSKKYMDKLFRNAGYKSTNVINILEEFAGKIISEVKGLGDSEIFTEESSMSFVVTSQASIDTYNNIINYLDKNGFTYAIKNADSYHSWDQIMIHKDGCSDRVLYMDLLGENIYSYTLDYENGILEGITYEGTYGMKDPNTCSEVELMLETNINNLYSFNLVQKVSIQEYVDILNAIGVLKYKRGGKVISLDDKYPNIENIVADYNDKSWIQRRITENTDSKKFKDVCKVITDNLDKVYLSSMYPFYEHNAKETSDFFALNF